ncbi:MAG: hypothetical protein PHY09_16905 [Desulfuromonadaceae bacterium]|nr:hypothetical protein [Desulfuromonadaceae bacterium]MDD5107004.1 hypothetical protein [Desulfuromonadaceae bacterium]
MPSDMKDRKEGVFHTMESAFRQLFRRPDPAKLEAERSVAEIAGSDEEK